MNNAFKNQLAFQFLEVVMNFGKTYKSNEN